jgi:hypothetical protein
LKLKKLRSSLTLKHRLLVLKKKLLMRKLKKQILNQQNVLLLLKTLLQKWQLCNQISMQLFPQFREQKQRLLV